MKLLLIRHAEATPREEVKFPDEERPLTEQGQFQTRRLAEALQRRGIVLGKVATSPFRRARQTAEAIVGNWADPKPEIVVCDALAPEGKEKKLSRFIRGLESDHVTLVGHMPDLAEYAARLIGDKSAAHSSQQGGRGAY